MTPDIVWDGEPLPDFDKPKRSLTEQLLETIAQELFDQHTLLERLLTTERTGAVSSVLVSYSAATKDLPSRPAPAIKMYAGSVPPVEEAIESYGRAVLLMQQAQVDGWEKTVAMLASQREHV